MDKSIFVVGNVFKDFCVNKNVLVISELIKMIAEGRLDSLPIGVKLVAGQGLREAEIQQVIESGKDIFASIGVDMQSFYNYPARASGVQTHKRHLHNSIISSPTRVSDDCFRSTLLLNEHCELMGDHQTGQHIQGMLLVEGARQMFLAVTEDFFIGPQDHSRYYFVINGLEVVYKAFVFPVTIELHYKIVESDISRRDRQSFSVIISVLQGDQIAAEISFKFTAFLADKIEKKEKQQAANLLRDLQSA